MTRLIVNADDYGHSAGVSAGIRKAHLEEIVTTTTTMMNYADSLAAIAEARAVCPRLGLGVHLVVTEGAPVLPPERVPTLVGESGDFHANALFDTMVTSMDEGQLRDEWRAQIERFLSAGASIDHLDSHHHAAYRSAMTMRVLAELANEYGVPVRIGFNPQQLTDASVRTMVERTLLPPIRYPAGGMINTFYGDGATVDHLLEIVEALPDDGTLELMVHPGYADAELVQMSSYSFPRERELAVLTDPRVREALAARGVELITFAEL